MKDLSDLTILSAENFTNIELRKRLEKMEVKINNSLKRKDLTKLYNDEVLKSEKIMNIQDLIEKDTEEIDPASTNILDNPFKKSKFSNAHENNKLKEKREQYKSQKTSEVNNSNDKNKILNDHLKVNEQFINDYLKNMGDTKIEEKRGGQAILNGSKSKNKSNVIPIISIDSSEDANVNAVNNKINSKSTNLFTTSNQSKLKSKDIPNNIENKVFIANESNNNTNFVPERKGREETMKKIELKIRGNDKNEKVKKMENEKDIKKVSSSLDKNIFTNNASSALKNMLGLSNDRAKETRNSMSISKEDISVREARDNKRIEDGLIGEKSIKFNISYSNTDQKDENGASALMETINRHMQAKDKSSSILSSTNKVLINRSKLNDKQEDNINALNKQEERGTSNLNLNFNDKINNVSKEKVKLENNPMNNDYAFSDQFNQFKNQFAKDFENINQTSQNRFSNQERIKLNIDNNLKFAKEENISIHSKNNQINSKTNNNTNTSLDIQFNPLDSDSKSSSGSKNSWLNNLLLVGGASMIGYFLFHYINNHDEFISHNSDLIIKVDEDNKMNEDSKKENENPKNDNAIKILFTSILTGVSNVQKSLSRTYQYLTENSIKDIFSSISSSILHLGTEFFSNNWQYILVIVFVMIVIHYLRKWYLSRTLAYQAFNEIRTELRNMFNTSSNINFDDGIFEEQIVIRFSDRFNLNDEYFRNNILPIINNYRQKDPQIKVFTKKKNGVLQNVWQWI